MSLSKDAALNIARVLTEALPYIQRFTGKTIVVKFGGNAMVDPGLHESFARDVVLMKLVGMNPVVVHGGGPQATTLSKRLGLEPKLVQGRRVTDEETLAIAKMVFAGQINVDILSALRAEGVRAVGLSGVDGDILHAVRRPPTPMRDEATGETQLVDFGHVGDVVGVNQALLALLLDAGHTPVLACIGASPQGGVYNINADVVAGKIAEILKAEKLVMLTNTPGVLDKSGRLLTGLTSRQIDELFAEGTISGGMLPKISSALEAARSGVNAVHIIDGRVDHCLLLEILTDAGVGTMIKSH